MAKRKTPKVKKPSKINNEELKNVQDTISALNTFQLEIGRIESRKHNILHNIATLNDKLTIIQSELEKEYGTSDIDVQTGEIKYPKNGKTD